MARISSFTVFVFVTLVMYTILSGGIYSAMAGTTFTDPYGGAAKGWELTPLFGFSEVHNLTKPEWPGYDYQTYTDLNPDRQAIWHNGWPFYNQFEFRRKGINWWDSWYWYMMTGSPKTVAEVLADWDSTTNYTKYVFDQGGQFETHCFIYPRVASSNMSEGFLYYPMINSIDNDTVTIVLACNTTYYTYDIGILFGVLTGFYFYGSPAEVSVILGGIWWVLCILTVVKLVVG